MVRLIAILTVMGVLANAGMAVAADMKPIHTQKTKDVVVTLMNEAGQWKSGKNSFVLEFTSAKDKNGEWRTTPNPSMSMPRRPARPVSWV